MISKSYLSQAVPSDINGLQDFASIALAATHLEDELIALGKCRVRVVSQSIPSSYEHILQGFYFYF